MEIIENPKFIITDIHDEYHVRWCGKLADSNAEIKNGLPVFVIIGSDKRIELNTLDLQRVEHVAKHVTSPKGRSAVSKDYSRIYVKENDGNEKLIGIVENTRIKKFAIINNTTDYT